jgi:hypothetical protein
MKNFFIFFIFFFFFENFFFCKTFGLSAGFCSIWKETKEKLTEKIKSPTVTHEEAQEAFWILFQMFLFEEKNPNDFVRKKPEKSVGQVLNHGLHVLGQLARSHGNQCEL